uniref:PB1 domain-containing protein n=1 Tax=Meloidogyne javanica TaxID=6303 RepID=A0A915LJG6_MELJA
MENKICWDHFGNKFHIYLNQNDILPGNDLVEVLYGKAREVLPEFRGLLACEDEFGHEIFLNNDNQLRSILSQRGNRLRIHTTLTGTTPSHLAASDFFEGSMAGDREVREKETDTKNVSNPGYR